MSETEPDKSTVVKKDFSDGDIVRFIKDVAVLAKRCDIRSVFIMTVDSLDHVNWLDMFDSEHHAALIALAMDDAKDDIKSDIFNEPKPPV